MALDLPGPAGEPFLGNIRAFVRNPLKFFEMLARDYGDMSRIRYAGTEAALLAHPDQVREVLVTQHKAMRKGPGLQRLRPLLGNSLLIADHEDHRRLRRLSQPAFSKQNLEAYDRHVTEEARRIESDWRDGMHLDMSEAMMTLTLRIVARALLGTDMKESVPAVAETLDAALALWQKGFNPITRLYHLFPTARRRRFVAAKAKMDRIIDSLVESHRLGEGSDDNLLGMLVAARDEESGQRLNDRELRNEVVTMMMAGHETTANALTWTWSLLSDHPDVETEMHAEIDATIGDRIPTTADLENLPYTRHVFTESMRLYPPAWSTSRTTLEDIELDGHPIPKGTLLFVSQWICHRDPRWFEDPDAFRPERWENGWQPHRGAYFPFGGGPRQCIGERFAWMEGILLLAYLGRRWRFRREPSHRVIPYAVVTLRPKDGMPMRVSARDRGRAEEPALETVSDHHNR